MIIQQNIAQSFQSPVVRVVLGAIAIVLLYVLWKEVRKIPAKLFTLMATAFMDMVGLLMIVPLLPFYVQELSEQGINILGLHFGPGSITGFIIGAFTIAQLLSAPMWGRLSDTRFPPRPTRSPALGGGNRVSDFRLRKLSAASVFVSPGSRRGRRHRRGYPGLRSRLD